jgi:hypothetical protein
MTTTSTTQASRSSTSFGALVVQGLLGGALAAVVNVAVLFGAKAVGVTLEGEFQPGVSSVLPLAPVVISSLVPALPSALVAWLLQKYTAAGARNFAVVAVVFTLVSFFGPVAVAGASVGTKVAMNLMHVVAALGIAGFQLRALRR